MLIFRFRNVKDFAQNFVLDFVRGRGAKTVDVSPFPEGGECLLLSFLVLEIAGWLIGESKKGVKHLRISHICLASLV